MKIEVKLFASLGRFNNDPLLRDGGFMVWEGAATVGDILDRLAVPRAEVKLVFINGRHAAMDTPVNDGDRVGLFPPIGGG